MWPVTHTCRQRQVQRSIADRTNHCFRLKSAERKSSTRNSASMTDVDALAIPDWPGLAHQFTSKCGPKIDRLLENNARFDSHFDFSGAREMTLNEAAKARAAREIEAVTERRVTAASLARKFGALFEGLCKLAGPDGAAAIFEAAAACARHQDFGERQRAQ